MIYTLFFNRYREDLVGERREAYEAHAERVYDKVVADHPGFVDMKTFTAEDGERLVMVRFRDLEAQHRWRDDAFHRRAQEAGRTDYYSEYRIVVCEELGSRSWTREGSGTP